MDIFFMLALSTLPVLGSLLLATKIWGKQAVIQWCRDVAWRLSVVCVNVGDRILGALRALIGVHLSEDDEIEDISDRVEERVAQKMHYELHRLEMRISRVEAQARMVIPVAGDSHDDE